MALSESLRKRITDLVTENSVMLFMKGTRGAPQCGFSAQVVQILDELAPSYQTIDVLQSPELRDGIKEFSQWPTIPQLFVNGKLVGGCDIVRDLYASGELAQLLGVEAAAPPPPPTITVTRAATEAFRAAFADVGEEPLHLKVDASFEYDLYFGPREPGDVEVTAGGQAILLDRASARRADGLTIDFIDGPNAGFKIESPHQPPRVKQLTAEELRGLLARDAITLFDVRPEAERARASIAGARPLDAAGQAYLFELDRNAPIALHCHHGVRSQAAAQELLREGFRNVYNLKGGIAAWSQIDPSVPQY